MYAKVISSLNTFMREVKLRYIQLYETFYSSLLETFEESTIVDEIIRATKRFVEKILIDGRFSFINLRNFVVHPKSEKEKLVLSISHYDELKEILIGKSGLLIKLLLIEDKLTKITLNIYFKSLYSEW